MLDFLISSVSQGLLWSILAIGIYLSFRILDIPDMTVEGGLPSRCGGHCHLNR